MCLLCLPPVWQSQWLTFFIQAPVKNDNWQKHKNIPFFSYPKKVLVFRSIHLKIILNFNHFLNRNNHVFTDGSIFNNCYFNTVFQFLSPNTVNHPSCTLMTDRWRFCDRKNLLGRVQWPPSMLYPSNEVLTLQKLKLSGHSLTTPTLLMRMLAAHQ